MTQDPNPDGAAVVTRAHRLAVAQCEGYAHLVHPGNEQHWAMVFVENGSPPGHNERWHALAQALADAEARGRTESQTELASVRTELEELDTALHRTHDVLIEPLETDLARLQAEVLRLEGEVERVKRSARGIGAPCLACGDSFAKCLAAQCCMGCNHASRAVTDEQMATDLAEVRAVAVGVLRQDNLNALADSIERRLDRITAALARGGK